ncbi:hypothetical protein [Microseira sp. BLCC-F43]
MIYRFVCDRFIPQAGRGGEGERGRWGDGEMGRWGDGGMGGWGDGENID